MHKLARNKFAPWAKHWNYLKNDEIELKFKSFRAVKYITLGFLGTFGRNNWQRNLLGTLDKALIDMLLPSSMHYIVVGIAYK